QHRELPDRARRGRRRTPHAGGDCREVSDVRSGREGSAAPRGPLSAPSRGEMKSFASRLIAWQRRAGRRDLPWQNTRDAYRIWISEIMLQQTQVATVIPYYRRFLGAFPDVRALAAAPIDRVRHAGIDGYPGAPDVESALWRQSEARLPRRSIEAYTQAMMDLGATVCLRVSPACTHCPVAQDCVARRENRIASLPAARPKK